MGCFCTRIQGALEEKILVEVIALKTPGQYVGSGKIFMQRYFQGSHFLILPAFTPTYSKRTKN